MPESFRMTADASGFREVADDMRHTAAAMNDAAQAEQKFSDQARRNRQDRKAGYRFPAGPNQRLLDLQEAHGRALNLPPSARREALLNDIRVGQFRAGKTIRNAEAEMNGAPSFGDVIREIHGTYKAGRHMDLGAAAKSVASGTRLLSAEGAGVEGLGAAGLAELAPIAGPALALGAALLVAEKGAEVFTQHLGEATGHIRDFTTARTISGGTSGQVARLGAMGLSGEEIVGFGADIRNRILTDSFARVAAGGMGLNIPLSSHYSKDQNDARLTERFLVGLRSITNAEEQLRVARIFGKESALELVRVSDAVFNAEMREAHARERLMDPATERAARDLAAGTRVLGREMEDLQMAFMKPFIQPAADRVGALNATLERLGPVAEQAGRMLGDLTNKLLDSATGGMWSYFGKMGAAAGAGNDRAMTPDRNDAWNRAVMDGAAATVASMDRSAAALEYIADQLWDIEFGGGRETRTASHQGVPRYDPRFGNAANKQQSEDWTQWHSNRAVGPW